MEIKYGDYYWRPAHDIQKEKNIKSGMSVLYEGNLYRVVRVDKHVHPICLGAGRRALAKDCIIVTYH